MTTTPNASRPQPQSVTSLIHRNTRFWMFFRIALGLGGAALVIFPVASGNGYVFSLVGLLMFVSSILFFPGKRRTTLEEKAREFGALVVADGGLYRRPNSSSSVPVQLFVAANRFCALDAKFRVLLEIPTAEITSFLALQGEKGWFLEIISTTCAAEFSYRGVSAEHLAHRAEDALRSVVPAPAPLIPQRRAAGA